MGLANDMSTSPVCYNAAMLARERPGDQLKPALPQD